MGLGDPLLSPTSPLYPPTNKRWPSSVPSFTSFKQGMFGPVQHNVRVYVIIVL